MHCIAWLTKVSQVNLKCENASSGSFERQSDFIDFAVFL